MDFWLKMENNINRISDSNSSNIMIYRYIDDVLSINNPEFESYLGQMYPVDQDTTANNTCFLPWFTSLDREGRSTSYFHNNTKFLSQEC